jgi:APA family basic amino acid/polyamine antiporter
VPPPVPPPPAQPLPASASLERRLGPLDAAAIVVSNVIGGGIFFVPIIVAQMLPAPAAMLWMWFLGGALAFAGAMAYAELSALRPRAGGEYVYLREAFGPLAAFLTGWTSFVAGFSGAIAASSVAVADYMGRFIPAAANTTPLLTIPLPWMPLVLSRKSGVALATIAILSLIHIRGLGPGRVVQNLLAGIKASALVAIIALGFAVGHGHEAAGPLAVAIAPSGLLLALVPIMFTYSGWNAATYVAEEVRDPGRNVPLALGLGTAAVILIYLGLNALYLHVLPVPELASMPGRLLDVVGERLFGVGAGNAIAVFTVVSLCASISAMTLAGPRVYYAMARDGMFLPAAASVHPRFHTPAVAIVAQALWSAVLVSSTSLSQLVSYTGFAVVLFSAVAVAALFVLRRREPHAPRPFRAWGYPWAPAIFVVASVVMLVNEIMRNGVTALAGLAVIAAGVPVYYVFARRRGRHEHVATGGRRQTSSNE